jgi:hypothetical protein
MNVKQQLSRAFAHKHTTATQPWPKYNNLATAEWVRYSSGLPWLELDVPYPVPVKTIAQEIENIKHLLVPHRTDYNEHADWSSFCIHGRAYDATREDSYYTDTRIKTWTEEAEQFMPETVRYFQGWPIERFHRIRVMALAPGGMISLHQDEAKPAGLGPVNIAITQPKGCDFYMEHYGVVPFEVGTSMMLNVSNLHTVINNSNEYRYHIIVHYDPTVLFDSVLLKSYNKAYAS